MYSKPPTVIIDAGSAGLKYGLDMDEEPKVIPSIIGYARNLANLPMSSKRFYVGKEAQTAMDSFETHPIQKRKVVNWEGMENLWSYTFQEVLQLREYRDRNVILAEPTLTPASQRGKTLQYMFEKYKFGGVCIGDASSLALRFADRSTGLVLDSGEEVTQVVPILKGYINEEKVQSSELGGKHVTNFLSLLLAPKLKESKIFNYDIVNEIKEYMCKVSMDYKNEVKDKAKLFANYPTGLKTSDQIKFDVERIKCTEMLFHPSLDIHKKVSGRGFSKLVYDTVQNCDKSLHKELYRNMVLAGGNTMFPGMQSRLKMSILAMQKANKVNQIMPFFATPEVLKYNYPTWKGALLVAKTPELERSLISRADYLERGIANLSTFKKR